MRARIHITLKEGVLDPQGKAIANALSSMDFQGIKGVRQGKFIELNLEEVDPKIAQSNVRSMCEQLLANTVIEDYAIEIDD